MTTLTSTSTSGQTTSPVRRKTKVMFSLHPFKKKRGQPASAKKSGTSSKRLLPWASSDSDTESQARGGITYTEDELAAMHNTAQEDP